MESLVKGVEVTNISELACIRDALKEHLLRVERQEEQGEDPDLYDIGVVEDCLDKFEMEISRQGY